MSYLLKAAVMLSAVLSVYSVALKDCKCWKDYEAKVIFADKVMCYGVSLFDRIPCNMPKRPGCVCNKEKFTVVLSDTEGTWCIKIELLRQVKRWACENEKEWAAYKIKYAEYEKNRQ